MCFSGWANAQQEFTLYHMPVISQSTYLNIAAVPEHKTSLSLPVLSSVFVGFNNSALSVKELVSKNGKVDYNGFVDGLHKKRNYIGLGANVDLFHLRVKVADNFFSFNTRLVNDFRFYYPKDLLAIGANGIKEGYSLSGLGIHFSSYMEYGLGFTRAKPDSKWTYGARAKLLKGIANIQTKSSDIELSVNQEDIYQYNLNVKTEVNMGFGVDGSKIEHLDSLDNYDPEDFRDFVKLNNGFAVDLGATYQFTNRLSFGVAVNNLGFINWKNFAENYKTDVNLNFEGAIIDNINFSDNLDSLINIQTDSVFDSYSETFENGIDTSRNAYKTWLPTNLFLSAHYQLSPRVRATGSVYTEFFKGVSVGLIAGVNFSLGRALDLTTSWWWFRKSAANLGLGIVYKPGPAQFYLVMDNVLPSSFVKINDPEMEIDGLLLPYQVKNFNLRIGMNFVFGRIKSESRLPNQGLSKSRDGIRRYLYKPSLK